jgi:hypothetical protein
MLGGWEKYIILVVTLYYYGNLLKEVAVSWT